MTLRSYSDAIQYQNKAPKQQVKGETVAYLIAHYFSSLCYGEKAPVGAIAYYFCNSVGKCRVGYRSTDKRGRHAG